ncbi:hypothetical protein POM88_012881 [Heracleum sosnowskyi]|uniref:Uncharacterized protein n=1 Tax=Heracleum sosnowskyi TaxID=360622 RepID=A0AAD8MXN0_9APIA|nr:hypothetical protein POM88_012881 [Heracleum sosnowskyi]
MAPRKEKGKSKEPASKESTNGRVGSSTRSSTRGRLRTPSPTPPGSRESPPTTPPSPRNPNTMTAAEERAWRGRKPRSNSMGKFGEKRPRKPIGVDIHGEGFKFERVCVMFGELLLLQFNNGFKKPSNVQGSQTRVVNSDIRSDATTGGNVVISGSARGVQNGAHLQSPGGSDAPVVVKQNVPPTQKVNRGVPKAPAPNSTPVSSNTAAPSTPAKGGGFPLQFGSISPGLMQVPARTSSAPPNLDE